MLNMTKDQLFIQIKTRRAVGITWDAICADLQVSRQAISQWLSGQTEPAKPVLALAELRWASAKSDSQIPAN